MKKVLKKSLSLLVCLSIILSNLSGLSFAAGAAATNTDIVASNKVSDPVTINWETFFGPGKMDTEFAGGVWTDKSVFTGATAELPGITTSNSNNFLVALSAIASNMSITGYSSSPTDTMLVLDVSGSMVNSTYSPGYSRSFNRYYEVTAIDMSLIEAMVESTNKTIDRLMKQNSNNRVGVVLYSGNTSTDYDATPASASVLLPLGRYVGVEAQYLTIDAAYTSSTLYTRRNNQYTSLGTVRYVPGGSDVEVAVGSGLTTEGNQPVQTSSKEVVGGTYIQNGLYHAMQQFLNVEDTVVPEGRPQAGAERQPVLVLMSDGAPTICTDNYSGNDGQNENIGNSNYGNGSSSQNAAVLNRIAVMTQLTAAYVRGRVAAHYRESDTDKQDITFLTLGLGTSADATATATLYPSGSPSYIKDFWATYTAAADGTNVTLSGNNFNGQVTVKRHAEVAGLNYVDKYFYAEDADDLISSFDGILSEIELKAETYATLVEGDSADLSGYVTFEDELGEMMQVADMKGILMSDGNGGTVLYTGKGIAESMTNGNLGSVENPTERGDELVRTVRERIPGLDTSMAQRLIAAAYADQQLFYEDQSNWSNYIGWYADKDGNYLGFWDKDSGYDNAPAGAVYANRSYGYLGVHKDTDMMHVVVQVRTELKSLHQTVYFKIPASLLPTVQYKITLNENDPATVDKFVRRDAIPMQLVFEVGLRPDINSVNLEAKIAEHLAKDAHNHIHRNNDGTVTFYTNEWAIGNDTNQNGIPDPEEVETAKVAESHFHPAKDNSRYYYTDDTPILDASGNTVGGSTRPSGTYYHNRYIYNETRRTVKTMPVAASTLQNYARYDAANDLWYIPAGTIFSEVERFHTYKVSNPTKTLSYSDYPAVFENAAKQDVYAFLGNNGALTVAPAQGIKLTKTVSETNPDPDAPTAFTFTVKLSEAVANPLITDTDGNVLTGISSVNGEEITVTLTAGQTVVISGIPTGTAYTVTEQATNYYTASSGNASGTVAAYTVHPVDFDNTARHYGSLILGKDVNYPQGFVPQAAHNNKAFTINVTFTGDTESMIVPAGAVRNGNTYTLQLKDGQSVTFSNIPEGVTYAVSEEGMPDNGYALNEIRYGDESRKIDGNDTDVVDVVNNYTLQPVTPNVEIQGTKHLKTNEPNWNNATFTVQLLQLENFGDEEHRLVTTATMSENEPEYRFDLSQLVEFDHAGTYYFHIVELVPDVRDDTNENIAYDRTYGLLSITVGDENADGNLEIQQVNTYQDTTVTGNSGIGWTVEKNFTNVVSTDRIYLDIQKSVYTGGTALNAHKGDITFGLFTAMDPEVAPNPSYYALTNTRGEATIMVPVTREMIQQEGVNGELVYYMREIAPAPKDRVVGMNYDESWIYAVAISWDDATNKAVTKYAPITGGTPGTYNDLGTFVFQHSNTYEEVDVSLELSGKKTLNGNNDLGNREFSFSLYHATAAFVKGQKVDTATNNGNRILFDAVSYTAPGIYYMVAEENASDLGGITIDPTVYHITVEIEKYTDNTDGTTKLRLVDGYPLVVPFGTSTNVGADGLDFDNTYTVTGSGEVVIQGLKTLSGKQLNANAFQIGLYSDAQCQTLIESVSNLADGSFSFAKKTYTAGDLGPNYTGKTETYYVQEIIPAEAVRNTQTGKYALNGITYDDTVYTVTVKVDDDGAGKLTVKTSVSGSGTVTDNVVALTISNAYKAKPVAVTINGSKVLSGDWTAVADKTFYFELLKADASFNITDEDPVKRTSVVGNNDFSMALNYTDGQEGLYYFVLREDFVNSANGIHYDAGEYHITVNVSDPGNGELVATVSMYRPGFGNANKAVFTNRYAVEPTSITLEGSKRYINSVTQQPLSQTEGMFTFSVLEDEVEVATGINLADSTIRFSPITYTAPGVHEYVIVENPGDAGGITYDDARFPVTVTVVDNGDGTLTAEATYPEPVAFVNTYTHEAAQVIFDGDKTLTGDWSAVIADNKTFLFELYQTSEFYTVSGTPVDFVEAGEGAFSFGAHTFTTAGTYYFAIREVNAGISGIDYDDETVYCIAVTVTDDGNGHLVPSVTSANAALTVTPDSQSTSRITISDLSFTNHYETAPATYTPEAKKLYTGPEKKEFNFVLEVNGTPEQTGKNDPESGVVAFDELTFETAGVYTLTIREQKEILLGLIRWDVNVYTITLHVEDNGLGQLLVNESKTTITSDKGTDDLIFRNAHHSVITKKDVFTVTEPTVSIDGKAVDKNDILLYKVSYKNYDSIPVDITIKDVIPQYTEYVEGSADNGGTLRGDTLTWTINDVAPNETVTVSFQVKVSQSNTTVVNGATVEEGENEYTTNAVSNPVAKSHEPPQTGDLSNLPLMIALFFLSGGTLVALAVADRKKKTESR